jgi:hypothetical protein
VRLCTECLLLRHLVEVNCAAEGVGGETWNRHLRPALIGQNIFKPSILYEDINGALHKFSQTASGVESFYLSS